MNILTNTPNSQLDGALLWARLDAVSVASDAYEALEAMRDLANAPDDARAVVVAQITAELDRLDAQAELDRPDAKAHLDRLGYGAQLDAA